MLQKSDQKITKDNNTEKIQILVKKFFPVIQPADLSNIINKILLECQLNLSSIIIENTVKKAIKKLLNNKASRLDRIPNKTIK